MIRTAVALMAIFAATASYSQPAKRLSSADQILTFALSKPDYSPKGRADLAALYSAYCREVLNSVPTNTPAEQAWVAEEGRTTDVKRIARLVQSKEYARHQLQETFSECLSKLSVLTQAQTRNDRGQEAAGFVSTAISFNESSDLANYATRVGLTSEEFQFPLLGSIRRVLMIAALRTLDSK